MKDSQMNRRSILKSLLLAPLFFAGLFGNEKARKESFKISMYGDLDDDLIVIRDNDSETRITDIYQMHNSKGMFKYGGEAYFTNQNPGFMHFGKKYEIQEDDIYCICLANEMEDAEMQINQRIRTHFKNEKLMFNRDILLKPLMPEYKSVPNYPLWFNEGDVAYINRQDVNGDSYNYYNLFENTVVQLGLVFCSSGNVKIKLFNQAGELAFTYNETVSNKPKYLVCDEVKSNKISNHPFVEINNILNASTDNPIPNNDYISNIIIEKEGRVRNIKLPYPLMYPNLISAVSVN